MSFRARRSNLHMPGVNARAPQTARSLATDCVAFQDIAWSRKAIAASALPEKAAQGFTRLEGTRVERRHLAMSEGMAATAEATA